MKFYSLKAALLGVGLLCYSAPASIFANPPTPPTSATGRCTVIQAFEGLCGNSRPNGCMSLPGVDYRGNPNHQKIWDDYYHLCVHNISPSKDRYSHECLDLYGLRASCPSSVEPLVEYQAIFERRQEQAILAAPKYEMVRTEQVAYFCGILSADGDKIEAYRAACGEVPPSACSVGGSVESQYLAYCGDKKPCQCLNDAHCGPACPPELGPPPLAPEPGPTVPALPPPAVEPGPAELPAPGESSGGRADANIGLGAENKNPGDSSFSGGAASSAAAPAEGKGCSLSPSSGNPLELGWILAGLIFGIFGRRLTRRFQ